MPRPHCYVDRAFNTIKAKRSPYTDFVPIGQVFNMVPAGREEVIVLSVGCKYSEDEVLEAYNSAGYPPVEFCVSVSVNDIRHVQRFGYTQYMALKLAGKL